MDSEEVSHCEGDGEAPPDGIGCVLCDEVSATIEDHNQHVEEVHDE